MSDFNLVDPRGWECDLQSVYSAYMGYFQVHNLPWYERSWGVFFESFEEFLTFSWPVITVTDAWTGKAHIVTRTTSVGAFLKMLKTRFGETLPMVEHILHVTPFETSQRHLRTISDYPSYKKLHSTLPAAYVAALKARVRSGEPKAIRELWAAKDKTFLAIDFEWSERNTSSCLEWGYAAARCGHLDAVGVWPPDPEPNYRRGHYIVSEYVDKVHNKYRPTFPWAYAFGDSQQIPKAKLPQVIQAVISSMASPDSETVANNLVLVAHGISQDLRRLEEMKIRIPNNVLIVDTASFERQLFTSGQRGAMKESSGKARSQSSTLSLTNMLQSLGVDVQCAMHNSGNDAFMSLLGLQLLLEPDNTKIPSTRGKNGLQAMTRGASRSPAGMPGIALTPSISMLSSPMLSSPMMTSPYGTLSPTSPALFHRFSPEGYPELQEAISSRRSSALFQLQQPPDSRMRKPSNLSPGDGRRNSPRHKSSSPGPQESLEGADRKRVASG